MTLVGPPEMLPLHDNLASFVIVGFPYSKEPVGQLLRSDGKRPIGTTLLPWQTGSSLASNVTDSGRRVSSLASNVTLADG